jgi:hypothetical protein
MFSWNHIPNRRSPLDLFCLRDDNTVKVWNIIYDVHRNGFVVYKAKDHEKHSLFVVTSLMKGSQAI